MNKLLFACVLAVAFWSVSAQETDVLANEYVILESFGPVRQANDSVS